MPLPAKGIFGAFKNDESLPESCDYLVIGAGCVSLGFVDALVAATKTDRIVMVDIRAAPGGHWNDAYPFSHGYFYGSPSQKSGSNVAEGAPDGWEVATSREVLTFFEKIMEGLVKTGRVRYLPMCKCSKDGVIESVVDPDLTWKIKVEKRIVDGTYSGVNSPLTHAPQFDVEPGAWVVPIHGLSEMRTPAQKYVIMGAGKTAMDAVRFLLRNAVDPKRISWVIPRNIWVYHTDVHTNFMNSMSAWLGDIGAAVREAALQNGGIQDMFRILESSGKMLRLDPSDEPDVYRCGTASTAEYKELAKVHSGIIRLGRVCSVGVKRLTLEKGSIATGPGVMHVDCTANGQPTQPAVPIWAPKQITLQPVAFCNQALGSGLLGHIEALYGTKEQDEIKNDLCRPVPPAVDLRSFVEGFGQQRRNIVNCGRDAGVKDFLLQNRLFLHMDDVPTVLETMGPMETAATAEDIERVLKNGVPHFSETRHVQMDNSQMGKAHAEISRL